MKRVPRYPPHGDDTSTYNSSTPYRQSTGDAFSSSPVLMSTSTFYPDPSTTTPAWTSETPYLPSTSTSTDYSLPPSSPSDTPPPPSITPNGPAAVSTPLSTPSSLSTVLLSTATANAVITTDRTVLIASISAGLSALLLLLLLAFLLYRRRRRRTVQRLDPRIDPRALPQSALLHDDEMARNAHTSAAPATMVQYHDAGGAAAAVYRSASPPFSILRSRVSESGSIFREEVWPPPSPTIDPIQLRSSQVDLSRIVDDVMGPTRDENNDPISETRMGHKRELTASSTTPLLVERQMSLTSSGHGSSEEDSLHVYASPSSLYSPMVDQRPYGLLPEAFPPVLHTSQSQGFNPSSSVTSISSFHSTPVPSVNTQSPSPYRPPSIGSFQGSIASSSLQRTQPKVSSPLVRTLPGFGGR